MEIQKYYSQLCDEIRTTKKKLSWLNFLYHKLNLNHETITQDEINKLRKDWEREKAPRNKL